MNYFRNKLYSRWNQSWSLLPHWYCLTKKERYFIQPPCLCHSGKNRWRKVKMKSSLDTCRPKNFDIMPVFEGTPIPCDLKKNVCHWFGAAYNRLKILVLDCDIIVITGFVHFLNYGEDYQKCNQERGFGSRCRFCRKSWRNNGTYSVWCHCLISSKSQETDLGEQVQAWASAGFRGGLLRKREWNHGKCSEIQNLTG